MDTSDRQRAKTRAQNLSAAAARVDATNRKITQPAAAQEADNKPAGNQVTGTIPINLELTWGMKQSNS